MDDAFHKGGQKFYSNGGASCQRQVGSCKGVKIYGRNRKIIENVCEGREDMEREVAFKNMLDFGCLQKHLVQR